MSSSSIAAPLLAGLHAAIDDLAGLVANSPGVSYDELVIDLERAARRIEAVRLGVIAKAEAAGVAAQTGLADTSSWLARHTRADGAAAARDTSLAVAIAVPDSTQPRPCLVALSAGALSAAHARVIVTATDRLPAGLSPDAVDSIERDLVEKATRLSPDQLRRVSRRALDAVESDPAVVDRHEDAQLRDEERSALARARLTWHDNGDGTTSGHFLVPTIAAAILTRVIQSMTAPRRAHPGATQAQAGAPDDRHDWGHRSGLALVELLEHLPTDHLHAKVAATVQITLDHDRLLTAIGAAGLDTGEAVSAGEARRLACGAGILPTVLGGASVPLDLGRSSRLFSDSQRTALAHVHQNCAADGCQRPYSWCELHHREPWSRGGRTDLADAVPLCGFHHRRIHDPDYEHRHEPTGVTFRRRR